jgi:FAD/FMN-containing dehydrogenase
VTAVTVPDELPSAFNGSLLSPGDRGYHEVRTAYPHRDPGYNLVMIGQWMDPADTDANVAWVKETYAALLPYMAPKTYVNYLADDESVQIVNAYGPNLKRLQEIKRRYDPDNLFRLNHNIDPAG